ncbi:MAG: CNNM domain-containing protein, partial [Thermotogae bacterium]|nr:CNNM domain-containing protein [Thermotogota bacterium]
MEVDPLSSTYILWGIFAILIMLGLSAFFSASETSMLSVSRKRLRDAISSDAENMNFENQLKTSNRYLTVILILNNVVNILLSSFTTVMAIQILPKGISEGIVITVVTIIVTIFIVIFGEITPKLYARSNAARFFNFSFSIVRFLDIVLRPITLVLNEFSNLINRLLTRNRDV